MQCRSTSPEFKETDRQEDDAASNQSVAQLEPGEPAFRSNAGMLGKAVADPEDLFVASQTLPARSLGCPCQIGSESIQTAPMNESGTLDYCREYGLYPEQLEAWKEAFESMDAGGPSS